MPSNRHNLILDEEGFQGLLSAAFIIQEYNERQNNQRLKYDRLKWAQQQLAEPAAPPTTESICVCGHCGAPKPAEGSPCANCGRDELRPGERLQRNWASMWMMSQDKDLGSERSHRSRESAQIKKVPPLESECDDQALGIMAPCAQALSPAEIESKSTTAAMDEMTHHPTQEGFTHEDSDLAVPTFELSASDDCLPIEAGMDEPAELPPGDNGAGGPGSGSLIQRLRDLRVRLRFQRSNLYLAGAVFVAALALFWPAASSPRRASLSPWERALVTLGLAEAPEPAVHLQGDPGIEVWVDPHTALYYCPGEEQYGKTTDGRLSSQREAQMDRFEPAGRSICE